MIKDTSDLCGTPAVDNITLTRIDDATLRIAIGDSDGGLFTRDFVKKSWGMWMMGAMKYTAKDGTEHCISTSSTDYELAFRVGGKTPVGIRGGNHGDYPGDKSWRYFEDDSSRYNDRMTDMALYDGEEGERLELPEVGKSLCVSELFIVIRHSVYEMSYRPENILIDVEKRYLYRGCEIHLNSTLRMAQRVNFARSFSCMLPIAKAYGNNMMLYNMDGTTTYAKTPIAPSGIDVIKWNFKATRVELWGDDNPEYHTTVEILNPSDQFIGADDCRSYVGLRDMRGGSSNKVYFAFGSSGITMERGEILHFVSKWSFAKIEGFQNPTAEPDVPVSVPLQ